MRGAWLRQAKRGPPYLPRAGTSRERKKARVAALTMAGPAGTAATDQAPNPAITERQPIPAAITAMPSGVSESRLAAA